MTSGESSLTRPRNDQLNHQSLTALWKGVSSMAGTASGDGQQPNLAQRVSKMNTAKDHLKMMEHN